MKKIDLVGNKIEVAGYELVFLRLVMSWLNAGGSFKYEWHHKNDLPNGANAFLGFVKENTDPETFKRIFDAIHLDGKCEIEGLMREYLMNNPEVTKPVEYD